MNFAQSAKQVATIKYTENGAMAFDTTDNALLDLFAQVGALRSRTDGEIEQKIAAAMAIDPLLTTKLVFYCGNIRGGLGERRTFRIAIKYLAKNYPSIMRKNLALIPHFNRWDSLFELLDTPVEKDVWKIIKEQWILDMNGVLASRVPNAKPKGISLMAKWMKSETAHSKQSRTLAYRSMKALGLTPRQYRKALSALRKHIGVVEGLMSSGQWDKVEYPAVPSYAMKNYRKAFSKHDCERFGDYLESITKGEAKINASTLYPYDLVMPYMKQTRVTWSWSQAAEVDPVLEAQWKALPNYVTNDANILVLADVSGSMEMGNGRPMATSIGLATYFAQRNSGDYHNLYMTFTSQPHFIALQDGMTLAQCVAKVKSTDVGYNTDLKAAFDEILCHALNNGVAPEEMPSALCVISDMEIDPYFDTNDTNGYWGRRSASLDFVQTMKTRFARYGYQLPKLVLWNVEARNDTFLTKNNDVILVSGQSASVFKNLCGALNGKTAWDFMLEVLNDPMYDCVTI